MGDDREVREQLSLCPCRLVVPQRGEMLELIKSHLVTFFTPDYITCFDAHQLNKVKIL